MMQLVKIVLSSKYFVKIGYGNTVILGFHLKSIQKINIIMCPTFARDANNQLRNLSFYNHRTILIASRVLSMRFNIFLRTSKNFLNYYFCKIIFNIIV